MERWDSKGIEGLLILGNIPEKSLSGSPIPRNPEKDGHLPCGYQASSRRYMEFLEVL
jgi:hypothetical protein